MPRQRAKERACERAIKKTLAYRVIFKYPLSFHQLAFFLISKNNYDYKFFTKTLRRLTKKRHIFIKNGKYYLSKYKPVSWDLRAKNTKEMLEKNMFALEILKAIPWIKMICVTGSVAAYNTEKESDLDIFIVTEKNRLWLTRGFTAVLLKITGRYPRQKTPFTKICANLFVDESNLTWPKKKQSIYTAYEIVLMQPLINKEDTYFRFVKENNWIFKYFNNIKINYPKKFPALKKQSKLLNILDNLALKSQSKYMEKKQTREITTKHFIHFRKNDNSQRIIKEYKSILKNI